MMEFFALASTSLICLRYYKYEGNYSHGAKYEAIEPILVCQPFRVNAYGIDPLLLQQ